MTQTTHDIFNYRQVNDQVATGGQPTEEQLRSVAQEGYSAVINLAPTNARLALPDEAGLVHALGMTYYHIPVAWDNPTPADFDAFEQALGQTGERKTFIHCVANFRVTAFYALYALKNLGWSAAETEAFRAPIWQGSDYPVWEDFIRQMQARILAGPGWMG